MDVFYSRWSRFCLLLVPRPWNSTPHGLHDSGKSGNAALLFGDVEILLLAMLSFLSIESSLHLVLFSLGFEYLNVHWE